MSDSQGRVLFRINTYRCRTIRRVRLVKNNLFAFSFAPRALLPKHRAKDQDTLIEQSLFASISKSMALPHKKSRDKTDKKLKI